MQYDLTSNDRFFLNQLIPMWETGKTIDLNSDLKYVFHREKGTNYNPAQFEYTLKTLSEFIVDHGFARDAGRAYTYNLQPKANMLMVKGTIELFEQYQGLEKGSSGKLRMPANIPPISMDIPAGPPINGHNSPPQQPAPQEAPPRPAPPPVTQARRRPETSYYAPEQHKENRGATTLFSIVRLLVAIGVLFLLWYLLSGRNA